MISGHKFLHLFCSVILSLLTGSLELPPYGHNIAAIVAEVKCRHNNIRLKTHTFPPISVFLSIRKSHPATHRLKIVICIPLKYLGGKIELPKLA